MANITVKDFISKFDEYNPDWTNVPEGFPDCNLSGLKSDEVGKFLAIMTFWELSHKEQPATRSRVWSSPRGYRYLVQWTNAVLLRILIRKFTGTLPRLEYRTKTQRDDAARSVVSNIEEGYRRPTSAEYLNFLGYSEASLGEVYGDINKCLQDGFLKKKSGNRISDLGLDLTAWKSYCGNPLNSSKLLYFPLDKNRGSYRTLEELKGEILTYEIFTELINKTDWLLRKLVESLEKKLKNDQKAYRIEQLRIRSKS